MILRKKAIGLLAALVTCSVSSVANVNATEYTISPSYTYEENSPYLRIDSLSYKYMEIDGVMYKRLWNNTKACWVDQYWTLVN